MDRDFGCKTETAVETPHLSIIYVVVALHRDAKVVNGLLFVDGIAVCPHLKVRGQAAVTES
jgi:hypothetical protein